jgi:acetyl-CoA acetyltransferase
MTTEAVIMSIARTPIGKTSRGVFNMTQAADPAAPVIGAALERAPASSRGRSRE